MLRPVGFGLVALSTLSSRIAPMLAGSATAAFVAAETWLGVPALRGRA